MMNDDKVKLWEAINAYVVACGGDPSRHVYGNTPRMDAVSEVEVERAVEEIATPGGVWTGPSGEPVSLGSVPFTPLLNACIEIARAASRGVVAGASDFGAIVREALGNMPLDEFVAEFERFDGGRPLRFLGVPTVPHAVVHQHLAERAYAEDARFLFDVYQAAMRVKEQRDAHEPSYDDPIGDLCALLDSKVPAEPAERSK